jgi:hypothetical protein
MIGCRWKNLAGRALRRGAAERLGSQPTAAQVLGDLSQALAGGREEAAEEPALDQHFQPGSPALHSAPEAFEDTGKLMRNPGPCPRGRVGRCSRPRAAKGQGTTSSVLPALLRRDAQAHNVI